jgi:hypothetical protein
MAEALAYWVRRPGAEGAVGGESGDEPIVDSPSCEDPRVEPKVTGATGRCPVWDEECRAVGSGGELSEDDEHERR